MAKSFLRRPRRIILLLLLLAGQAPLPLWEGLGEGAVVDPARAHAEPQIAAGAIAHHGVEPAPGAVLQGEMEPVADGALEALRRSAAEPGEEGALPADGLSLELSTAKPRPFLQEPVQVTVTLVAGSAMLRNIEYPRLTGTSFTLSEFDPPLRRSLTRDGRELTVYQFRTTLIPRKPGTLVLGPARIRCEQSLPASGPAGFFGGTESRTVELASAPFTLTVLPLPVRGRPAGFSGAVGRFTVSRTLLPDVVQAGDPVTVRTVVRGTGELGDYACDSIDLPGLRGYPPSLGRSGSEVACEQVLVPDAPGLLEIPAARVHFFAPEKAKYRTALSEKLPLRVSAIPASIPTLTVPSSAKAQPPRIEPASVPLGLYGAGAGLLLAAGAGASYLLRGRRRRLPKSSQGVDPAPVIRNLVGAAEAALDAGDADAFYTALFRALQACLGSAPHSPPAGITAPPEDAVAPRILFSRCDRVRYGGHRPGKAEMSADLQLLREIAGLHHP